MRLKNLDLLRPAATQPMTQTALWATVTQASPLRIQLDTDTAPLDVTPDTLVAGLALGDRVWCQLTTNTDPRRSSRRLVVVGRAGGGWRSYTPQLTASTTDPTLGTGASQVGHYLVDPATGMVDVEAIITFGTSGTNAGSGTYRVSMPTAIDTIGGGNATGASIALGYGSLRDNSAIVGRNFLAQLSSVSGGPGGVGVVFLSINDGTFGAVNQATIAWDALDVIELHARYRMAAS